MLNPFEGELLATKAGLVFAWKLGTDKVELEGDAINVYQCIRDGDEIRS